MMNRTKQPQQVGHSRRSFIQQTTATMMAAGLLSMVNSSMAKIVTRSNAKSLNPLINRQLGINGPVVSALGLGCMGMSEFYGAIDHAEVQRTLAQAYERGVTFFDSADMYGHGHNEELLGRFMVGRRSKIILATKFGIVRDAQGVHMDNSPAYVKSACEASLRRLKTDYIDVYYAHRINPTQPVEEMVDAMATLVKEGKVRHIGLSEAASETIRKAHAIYPLAAVETEYSLFSREPEQVIIPTCRELGIAFVAYAPLSRGLLTGKAPSAAEIGQDDFRKNLPRFQPKNFAINQSYIHRLLPIAQKNNCTLAQLSLAWLLTQGNDIIPIPGTRQVARLNENLNAALIQISNTDLTAINQLFPLDLASGKRYTDDEMKTVGL